jgi:hypothetical protein
VTSILYASTYKYLAAGGDAKRPGAYQRSGACDQRSDSQYHLTVWPYNMAHAQRGTRAVEVPPPRRRVRVILLFCCTRTYCDSLFMLLAQLPRKSRWASAGPDPLVPVTTSLIRSDSRSTKTKIKTNQVDADASPC